MDSVNFNFIQKHNPQLHQLGRLAEDLLHIDPGASLIRLRAFGEEVAKSIYAELNLLPPYNANFSDLIHEPTFQQGVSNQVVMRLNYLRKEGNKPAHGEIGQLKTAVVAMDQAFQLAGYLALAFYGMSSEDIPAYKEVLPQGASAAELKELKEALEAKAKEVDSLQDKLDEERRQKEYVEASIEQLKAKQAKGEQAANSLEWDEAKTRALMIDAMLEQAGWQVGNKEQVGLETEVQHQPTNSGIGYADYVLWGEDGKPLAVVEAKKASVNLNHGREQAKMYADGLEQMHGQRPVIFYTNGFETHIWDDVNYASPRLVYGFYSRDSLNYMIYQRQYRKPDIQNQNPDLSITDRSYQIEAIKTVCAHFESQRRSALIVQATGTGKTRVAIALSKLMGEANWAKRILFLCDRKELRRQALTNYKALLPSEPRHSIGETGDIDEHATIYVATYPGMMNRFQQLDVGYFDMIIADESHRSIYNKYRDIFDYFDALQVGLTATPVEFVNRNTFTLFGCEEKTPSFAFTFDDAISHQPPFLCEYEAKEITYGFIREGLAYDDLNEEQQAQLEEDLGEEKAKLTKVKGKNIGKDLFSEDTDRRILENLMQNGIKDATGSQIGKTIIFAQNQKHADHLHKVFCDHWPQYGAKACKVIHNKVTRADTLIDNFKKEVTDFRIAISVDMLDTGIDVPEVVNLVFAKPVRSKVKFWQMIGRGTRLSENLFGPGQHKTKFLIFDHYENFTYFKESYKEVENAYSTPLLQQVFEARIQLAEVALKQQDLNALEGVTKLLRADVTALPEKALAVRRELKTVHQLQQTELIEHFQPATIAILKDKMAPLMAQRPLKCKDASQWDLMMAQAQIAQLQGSAELENIKSEVLGRVSLLAINLDVVKRQIQNIEGIKTQAFWLECNFEKLEEKRIDMRSIMQYRQKGQVPPSLGNNSTKTVDEGETTYTVHRPIVSDDNVLAYKLELKRTLEGLMEKSDVLKAINNGQQVTEAQLQQLTSTILSTNPNVPPDVLNDFYGRTAEDLAVTIRELIGLQPEAVNNHFQSFLHNHPALSAVQVKFLNLLKGHIANNGTIEIKELYAAPFTSLNPAGPDGVFSESDVDDLIAVLKPYLKPDFQAKPN